MLPTSTRLGPYEILAPLGAGGMGEVYRARDTRLGREVAVKVLPESLADKADRQARFEREARAVAALSHPNILAIHDYGTHGSVIYAVMELLEGETLRDRLSKGPLPWREGVEIGAAIADGLAAAHAKGIVHRDLKPENLFLTGDGRVKILDFGLARVQPVLSNQTETSPYVPAPTDSGVVMGTVGYMSPEQVRSQPADARSDIFSFGCVLYEMLTGQRAFQRETGAETMTAILHDEPQALGNSGKQVTPELGRIIRQCLAKGPNQRLQSARDLALALRATASDPSLHRPPLVRRRYPLAIGVIAALLVVGVIAASIYFRTQHEEPHSASQTHSIFPAVHNARLPESGPSAAAGRPIDSLAILPLVNVTGDPKAEALCDTIAEEVSTSLAQIRDRKLKVRPITSTIHYKGKNVNPRTVGSELEVQAVITGRLRKDGNNLAIRLELIDARENDLLWPSKEYKGSLDQIMNLQNEIARDVALNLGLQLSNAEEKQLPRRYTNDPAAYLLFREGRYQWEKGTEEAAALAVKDFQAATNKDPKFALAYAWQARAYVILSRFREHEDNRIRAKESAAQALLLDENLAEGHAALGFALFFLDLDWRQAQSEVRQALVLDPKSSHRHLYGFTLAVTGNVKEAISEIEQSVKDDPRYVLANLALIRAYLWDRRYQDALVQARKTVEISRTHLAVLANLGTAHVRLQQYSEALATFQEALKLAKDDPLILGLQGYTYALAGKRLEAERVLKLLQKVPADRPLWAYGMAALYTGLGDKDQAFHWLNESCSKRDGWIIFAKVDPLWESLRKDPRFDELLERLSLVDKGGARDQGVHSVAVLPFVNETGDLKMEFLSDGVADQIINSLSQIRRRGLKVRPFTSVARYKGKAPDIPTFGRELLVEAMVTGKLHQQGDDLIISVALVDVRDETQFWGDTYHGKLGNILDLQDRIAYEVATKLRLQLTGEEEQRLTKRFTEDPQAYLFFREAIYHFNKFSEQGLTTAIEYCERAIKSDPQYALAYALAARCQILRGTQFRGIRETGPEARKYIEQALKINEDQPEAHAALGALYMFLDWNWDASEREFKRAIEIDPDVLLTWNLYGFCLAARGRLTEAIAKLRHGQELDPLAAPRRFELAMCYNWMRDYDQAIVEARKALSLDPNLVRAYEQWGLALTQKSVAANLKRFDEETLAVLQKGVDFGKRQPLILGLLGYSYVAAGKVAEAHKLLQELDGLARERKYGSALALARIHAALGEKDQALEWLRKACDQRESETFFLKIDPTLDNLRSDSRFNQILKEMGLPP
jgi:serine/threonine-protein kinase